MKISAAINSAFRSKAGPGVFLDRIEVANSGTVFWVTIPGGIELPIYCKGKLTPGQAKDEAPRVAAYASSRTEAAKAR